MAISKYQVMMSNAGFYIGRDEDGEPYDRISDYCRTRKEAEELLTELYDEFYVKDCGCIHDKMDGQLEHLCSTC